MQQLTCCTHIALLDFFAFLFILILMQFQITLINFWLLQDLMTEHLILQSTLSFVSDVLYFRKQQSYLLK